MATEAGGTHPTVMLSCCSHVVSTFVCSGGIPITLTRENVDSVAEPIMIVTVITNTELSVYYQVRHTNHALMVYYSHATLKKSIFGSSDHT